MPEVVLTLKANNAPHIKAAQEAQKATQKIYDEAERGGKREKGILEEIEGRLNSLNKARQKAFTIEDIAKYNKKIQETKLNLEEYEKAGLKATENVKKSGDSMVQSIGKWALGIASVTKLVTMLGDAVKSTTWGMNLFNQVGAITKQVMYEIVSGVNPFQTKILVAIKAQKEMNKERLEGYKISLEAAKKDREYQELYAKSVDQTLSKAERLKTIDAALKAHNEAIDLKIRETKALQLATAFGLSARPGDEKLIAESYRLAAELENLEAERVSQTKRLIRTRTEILKEGAEQAALELLKKRNEYKSLGILNPFGIDDDTADYIKNLAENVDKLKEDIIKRGEDIIKKSGDRAKKVNDVIDKDNQKRIDAEKKEWEERISLYKEAVGQIENILTNLVDQQYEDAQRQRELLDTRISELEEELQTETELYEAGYASNVNAKRVELQKTKELRDRALIDEQAALQKKRTMEAISQGIDIASAVMSIISKTFKNSKTWWQALISAGIGVGAMFTLIANSKKQIPGAVQLGEGGSGTDTGIITGRSHARGGEGFLNHVEVEHGEAWGVLNIPATKKFGKVFHHMVSSFNKGQIPVIVPAANVDNNVLVDNTGSNSRLDTLIQENRKIKEELSKGAFRDLGDRVVITKGNTVRTIRR